MKEESIQTRSELYEFLRAQMQKAYIQLYNKKRLEYESYLIKSFVLEVDVHMASVSSDIPYINKFFIEALFKNESDVIYKCKVNDKDEAGFFELIVQYRDKDLRFWIDTVSNNRFWLLFSLSNSAIIDQWLKLIIKEKQYVDHIWLWPNLLELLQKRGKPRGFSLDYDYRNFEQIEDDRTTYLKMQLWGGEDTNNLYEMLKKNKEFADKVVLSKIKMKEFADADSKEDFAIQDIKYTGKFTTRGTDFSVHINTLGFTRNYYDRIIRDIENKYSLRWEEKNKGNIVLEGYALNFFLVNGREFPVEKLFDAVFSGTLPFKMSGYYTAYNNKYIAAEIVDLHNGGNLSIEIYPDILTLYFTEDTCGNSIARLYSNMQHYFNSKIEVEADNGDKLFQS